MDSKTFVFYIEAFDPIKIETYSALKNDHQAQNFVNIFIQLAKLKNSTF